MFRDRDEAGTQLAAALRARGEWDRTVVLGLARGGVPVAAQVARALDVPLDVCIVRKLGVPSQPELAMGAVASGGVRTLNEDVMRTVGVSPQVIELVTQRETEELVRRENEYRAGRPAIPLRGHTVVLVDDGLATGASMRAAVEATRKQGAERVVVAVPVAPAHTCRQLREVADDLVCLLQPEYFLGVGQFYADFRQVGDAAVVELLLRPSSRIRRESARP